MAPGDVLRAENARIARFLLQLEEMERQRRLTRRASPAQLNWLARPDTTESSRRTHDGRTNSADPSAALMVEEEYLRTLRFAPGAVSQRMSTSGGANVLLADAPPLPKSPARLPPIRAGSGDFGNRLSPKGKPRPPRPERTPVRTPSPMSRATPTPKRSPARLPSRGSSPSTLARPHARWQREPEPEPEPEPELPKKGTTGMPIGEDVGLPKGVTCEFLQPFYREVFPDMDSNKMQQWIKRYGQCGIFTTVQLLHALKTRAVSKTVPIQAHWRGRAFLVNELIETCSDSTFLSSAESDALIQAIQARPARPTGPELGSDSGLALMEPALHLALAATGRLDLRPSFVQLGILGYEAFQAATAGAASREISILQLPLNLSLKKAGQNSIGFELIETLLAECRGELPPGRPASQAPAPELAPHCHRSGATRCWMYGKEGHGADGQWAMVPKEETALPGSRKDEAHQLQSNTKKPEPADVILMKGDMPMIIAVPHGGLKGSSAGSAKSFQQWADWTTSRTPHSVQIVPEPRGALGFKVGSRICNAQGTVRAVVAQEVDSETATEIVYRLESSSPGDFGPNDHIFMANVMWKRAAVTSGDGEAVFKVGVDPPKIASVAASMSPVLELAEAVREACWMSSCLTPYVVLCNLDPSKVDVAAPLSETVPEHQPQAAAQVKMANRASAAWHNYHACIELAKQEVAKMTGGAALLVELLVEGHVQEPCVSISYGLREFEVDIVSRPPGQAVKKAIDRATLLKTFFAFDADGSGAVDADELKAAATKFGLPMTDADIDAAMASLGKTREEEISKKEFISWFQGLSKSVRATVPLSDNVAHLPDLACPLSAVCCGSDWKGWLKDGTHSEELNRRC